MIPKKNLIPMDPARAAAACQVLDPPLTLMMAMEYMQLTLLFFHRIHQIPTLPCWKFFTNGDFIHAESR